MKKVSWDDLTISMTNEEIQNVYEDWLWLLNGRIRPLMVTKFGDLFFQKEDGKVYFLDTIEGKVIDICSSEDEFIRFINLQENIDNYLLSYIIFDLVNQNKIPGNRECYSFIIPPILGGKISSDNVNIMSFVVSISITAQIHKQVKDMPEGTSISEFKFVGD